MAIGEPYGPVQGATKRAHFTLWSPHRWMAMVRLGLALPLFVVISIFGLVGASSSAAEAAGVHPCSDSAVVRGGAEYQIDYTHQASLVRLYCAAFFREPDEAGFAYWDAQWSSFVNVQEQAKYFVSSDEFADRFGPELTAREFLAVLYDHVFLREPDSAGLEYWEDLMTNDVPLTQGRMLELFAESAEMIEQVPLPTDRPRLERAFIVRDNPWGGGIMLGIDKVPHRTVPPLTRLSGSGVFINSTIYPHWNAMVSAARAAGYTIRVGPGGGYRSYDAQVSARIRNGCPDIYISDSDTCRIPTSRPGESNHQSGLAVDLDLGGSTRGSLTWLRANAHQYGFYAFFSEQQPWGEMTGPERTRSLVEPWHWSHNGR